MIDGLFAPGFKTEPYWWDAAPPEAPDPEARLPEKADAIVIGSGHTGLSAALTLTRAGRETLVLEAEAPGHGASTRNAGYVGRTLYSKFSKLEKRYGTGKAAALAREGIGANEFVAGLIEREQLACSYVACGRFVAAATAGHYDTMAREYAALARHVPIKVDMVPRAEQRREIASDHYRGGAVLHGTGALHPGLFHRELLDRTRRAGARVVGHAPVTAIVRDGAGFALATPKGATRAGAVVVATNGYTGGATPALRRRIIPVAAFMIATEPLGATRLDALLPSLRTMIDSKINIYWARRSPDGERLLFGARTGIDDGPLETKARKLHGHMIEVFPQLHGVRLSHCWTGNMGFTFDLLPHHGVLDGVHYAAGFCGVGIPMGSYLGHKAALKVLGDKGATTAFDGLPFPTRPFYAGNPWFLPPLLAVWGLRDRLGR
ncbi:MAG: NAD(P)/FAD-dependent oxidoreductase [Alphaproteobacteria bacterium]